MCGAMTLAAVLSILEPPAIKETDLERFPPACVVDAWIPLIREHWRWVEQQAPLHVWDREDWEWRPRDMYLRWDLWDDLQRAHHARDADSRKYHLRIIREKIGYMNYAMACFPDPVPVELFRRFD